MNKVIVNGVELKDAEVVISTNQKPDVQPNSGGGPGEEPPPKPK